jgi:hypothetical protein
VTVKSSQDTKFTATGKYSVDSTGDLSLDTKAKLSATSLSDTKIAATGKLDASAVMDATLKGLNVTAEAQVAAKVKGGVSLDLAALQITGSADAKMDMGGPMTTIGKNLTTISGQLIKLDGALIKMG